MTDDPRHSEVDLSTAIGTWTLDPDASTVTFTARGFWGLMPVTGTFETITGSVEVRSGTDAAGTVVVDAASVSTGMSMRDKHLVEDNFLAAESHPRITFAITAVTRTPAGTTVAGTLTIRDTETPLTLDATVRQDGAAVLARVSTPIVLPTYGMTPPLGMVRPEARVNVEARFVRS